MKKLVLAGLKRLEYMDTAEAACKIMCDMASFDDAGVAGKL